METMMSGFMTFVLVLAVLGIIFAIKAIKVVPQQSAWIVERLGKFHAVLNPGLNVVIPFIDRVAYKHSLKEVPLDTPSQVCITKDNTLSMACSFSKSPTRCVLATVRVITSSPSRNWHKPPCVA